MTKRKSKTTIGPVEFIDRVIKRDEKGEPFTLARYQRRVLEMALRRDRAGIPPSRTLRAEEIMQDIHGCVLGFVVGSDQPAQRDHHG